MNLTDKEIERLKYFLSDEFYAYMKSQKIKSNIKEIIFTSFFIIIIYGVIRLIPFLIEINETLQKLNSFL